MSDTKKANEVIEQLEGDFSRHIYQLELTQNLDPRRLACARTNFEQAVLWLKASIK